MEVDLKNYKGYSGCKFKVDSNGVLVKYASNDKKRINDLKHSYSKTLTAHIYNRMRPFKVVEPLFSTEDVQSFRFGMRHIDNAYNVNSPQGRDLFFSKARTYFKIERSVQIGFVKECKIELSKIKDSKLKSIVENLLHSCSDEYPVSFSHGDFGVNNFLVKGNEVYTFDLSPAFINSILLDIATLQLSVIDCDLGHVGHEVLSFALKRYAKFKCQIDIVRKIRVLQFYNEENTESTKIIHERMFNA